MKASVRTRPSRVLPQESEAADRLRLFLALDLPSDVREHLWSWGERELAEELRPVAQEDLHVTLAFLGRRPAGDVGRIWSAASQAVDGLDLPWLEPGAVMPVPRRRPRLLALDLADPTGAGAAWHAAVGYALEAAALYEREERPFWPHVTLARGRKGARIRAPRGVPDPAPFAATALTLYRSDLSPRGARYTAVESTGGGISSAPPPAAADAPGRAGGLRRAP